MKKTLLLLFSLLSGYCYGQFSFPYYSLSPSWEIERYNLFTTINEELSIKLGQDTSFCGHTWNSVDYFDHDDNFIERIGYCRQENEKVYVKKNPDCSENEFLMYDFTVEKGDAFYCGVFVGGIVPVLMTVDNKTTVWIDGVPKKSFSVSYQDPFYPFIVGMIWVEGVGDYLTHPFYSLDCRTCGEVTIDFNCLKLNERLVFNNPYTFPPCAPTIDTIYVNQNLIGGNNNGVDWDNAFYDLQDAMGITDSGDVILVAQGIYFPTSGDDRTASFLMPRGVSLFGGFLGSETAINQRDFAANPTILSGDIGVAGENTDNSYHVLFSVGADSATVIDGFIIEKGRADHPNFSDLNGRGGGYYLGTNNFNTETDPSIRNCIFRGNVGRRGGAIYCDGRLGHQVLNNISDCQFLDNLAMREGGAIYKKGGMIGANAKLEKCEFNHNQAFSGGAIYMTDILGTQEWNNCLFLQDTAEFEGGAVFMELFTGDIEIKIKDCEFIGNIGDSGGAISFIYGGDDENDSLSYIFESTRFIQNASKLAAGGAVALFDLANKSSAVFKNTIFDDNRSINGGAGLLLTSGPGSKSQLKIKDCIFSNNIVTNVNGAGAIFYSGGGNGYDPVSHQAEITNSLFYGNGGALAFSSGVLGTVEAKVGNCTFFDNGDFPIAKNWSPDFDDLFFNNMRLENSIMWEHVPVGKLFYNGNPSDYTIHD